ncbi:MAG TPA: dephospho-CoA kinase [Solirubrobacteraceae bacterium]
MSTDRVPFVALTGGLGAGKSTALEALGRLGAAVLSSDKVVHELYATAEVRDAVVGRFGEEVAPGEVVDRRALAGRMFASDEDRSWVEAQLWPRVRQRMAEWRDEVDRRRPPPPVAVVEVPLLFESGLDRAFDATIAVVADETVRADRAGARGHAAVAERTARQLSQEEKAAKAGYVVVNDGTPAELENALSAVLDMLRG